jgi:hypothetical protein
VGISPSRHLGVAQGYAPSESGRIEINRGGKEFVKKGFGMCDGSALHLVSGPVQRPESSRGRGREREKAKKGSLHTHRENQKRGKLS